MNITSAVAPRPSAAAVARSDRSTARSAASEAAQPQDKVQTDGGTEIGNGVKFALGGVSGLALTIPAMYAGVVGGAVVGSLFGAGLGPAISSVTTHGALGFLGGIWHSTSFAAKAGMFIGGTSGLVGGWKAGTGIGKGLGRLLGAAKQSSSKHRRLNKIGNAVTTAITGVGFGSGLVGGGMIGAGIGATGSLIAGGFSLANLGGPALIGAAVGAGLGGLTGAAGSYTISRDALDAVGFVADKAGDVASDVKGDVQQSQPQPAKDSKQAA